MEQATFLITTLTLCLFQVYGHHHYIHRIHRDQHAYGKVLSNNNLVVQCKLKAIYCVAADTVNPIFIH